MDRYMSELLGYSATAEHRDAPRSPSNSDDEEIPLWARDDEYDEDPNGASVFCPLSLTLPAIENKFSNINRYNRSTLGSKHNRAHAHAYEPILCSLHDPTTESTTMPTRNAGQDRNFCHAAFHRLSKRTLPWQPFCCQLLVSEQHKLRDGQHASRFRHHQQRFPQSTRG